ncbi:MAG TPA: pyroglutamyl-peptidase I [Pseudolabrys sp.]|nr:pyroglutamyl-peptidase I [Pseudolabrys sp.]
MTTILVTGFGPFPGAPLNPTAPLVRRLAHLRRPALADVTIVPHVFATSYDAVDRDLPRLIARHRPDALMMFGLAPRARWLRIETRARNALALLPDAGRQAPRRRAIAKGEEAALPLPAPARRLLAAARTARVPAALSRDAGRYLCNYLCWRAAAAARRGPRIAAFVHVPPTLRKPLRPGKNRRFTLAELTRAGGALLAEIAAAARR